jgi:FMN phosphatase YigB (HAD superfamily)
VNNRPDLIVFDLDNTLYLYEQTAEKAEKELFRALSMETGVRSPDEIYFRARQIVKARLGNTASAHSRLLYLSEFFRILKIAPSASLLLRLEQIYWNTFLLNLQLDKDAKALLVLARSMQIDLAIVTDLTLQIQLRKLVRLELDEFFQIIISSEDTGSDKNGLDLNPILTEIAQTRRIWFIGDQVFDFPLEYKNSNYFLVRKQMIPSNPLIKSVSFSDIIKLLEKAT